jgi:hypothetical protein
MCRDVHFIGKSKIKKANYPLEQGHENKEVDSMKSLNINEGILDQWMLRIVGTGSKPPFQETVDWLQTCLQILRHYVDSATVISSMIFSTSVSFLRCSAIEYHKRFNAALNIVLVMARKPNIVDGLGERENLLQLMLALKTDDWATIGSVFEIVFSLLMGGHVNLLGSQPSTIFLAIFSLAPYLWSSYKKAAEAAKVTKSLAGLSRTGNVQDALNGICYCEK